MFVNISRQAYQIITPINSVAKSPKGVISDDWSIQLFRISHFTYTHPTTGSQLIAWSDRNDSISGTTVVLLLTSIGERASSLLVIITLVSLYIIKSLKFKLNSFNSLKEQRNNQKLWSSIMLKDAPKWPILDCQ